MKDYIERAAVLNETQEIYHWAGYESRYDEFVSCEDIRNIPAADVVEVRHGRWETAPCNGVYDMRCSACGFAPGIRFYSSDYCPNCGARMDKEDEHEAG